MKPSVGLVASVRQVSDMRILPYTIAVDFDGTLSLGHYPNIGLPNKPLFEYLIRRQKEGCAIILWTCRELDSHLLEAVEFCKEQGLEFDAINQNLPKLGFECRKIVADEYIDDLATNVKDVDYGLSNNYNLKR